MNAIRQALAAAIVMGSLVVHPSQALGADGTEPAPERVERALIANLKSQLVYGSFKDSLALERSSSSQTLIANNVRYHTGFFSSPSGDISSAVKERCAVLGGTYAAGGDEISMGSLLISREDNGRWVSKDVVVSPGNKVQTHGCDKDGLPVIQAILSYKGSRTAGGNVFSADFYDLRVTEKTSDFASPDDRKKYLANAAAMGSKTASKEFAAIAAEERAERDRQQQTKDIRAAEDKAKSEAERAAAESVRLQALAARLPAFRTGLKIGDDTSCGLVIEVKQPIAQIQMSSAVQWMKVSELLPPGEPCVASAGAGPTLARVAPPSSPAPERTALRACRVDRKDAFKASPYTTCVTGNAKWTFAQIRSRCEKMADNEMARNGSRPAITDLPECLPADAICEYRDGVQAGITDALIGASQGVLMVFNKLCETSLGVTNTRSTR